MKVIKEVLPLQVQALVVGGWFIYFGAWVGGQGGGYHIFSNFCSVFVLFLIFLSWWVHDSLLCLFHCFFVAFFVSGPFN